jgi:hypothetical protein
MRSQVRCISPQFWGRYILPHLNQNYKGFQAFSPIHSGTRLSIVLMSLESVASSSPRRTTAFFCPDVLNFSKPLYPDILTIRSLIIFFTPRLILGVCLTRKLNRIRLFNTSIVNPSPDLITSCLICLSFF